MRKHFQDIFGTCIGWITGWITSGLYENWIQPMILAAVCAFIGLLVTHFGKRVLAWLEKKDDRWKSNGRSNN